MLLTFGSKGNAKQAQHNRERGQDASSTVGTVDANTRDCVQRGQEHSVRFVTVPLSSGRISGGFWTLRSP